MLYFGQYILFLEPIHSAMIMIGALDTSTQRKRLFLDVVRAGGDSVTSSQNQTRQLTVARSYYQCGFKFKYTAVAAFLPRGL